MSSNTRSNLILVIGDIHAPHRVSDLPPKFKEMLSVPGKIQYILCTGNLCSSQMEKYLKSICTSPQNIYIVKGDMDHDPQKTFPQHEIVQIGGFRYGIVHGHQIVPWNDKAALSAFARKLNVDVLISGHTHQQHIYEYEGRYFVNPGSASGAYTPLDSTNNSIYPSFALIQSQGDQALVYTYQLKSNNPDGLNVQKTIMKKNSLE